MCITCYTRNCYKVVKGRILPDIIKYRQLCIERCEMNECRQCICEFALQTTERELSLVQKRPVGALLVGIADFQKEYLSDRKNIDYELADILCGITVMIFENNPNVYKVMHFMNELYRTQRERIEQW